MRRMSSCCRRNVVRHRFKLIWMTLILGAAMALPASAAATTGYTFSIVNQHCYGALGQNVYFRVKLTAAASTTATKLTIKSKSQYYSGGKWHTFYKWGLNQSSPPSIDYSYTHEGTNQYNWRIVSTLKAMKGKTVLAHKTLTSKAC